MTLPTLVDEEVARTFYFVPGYEWDPQRFHTLELAARLSCDSHVCDRGWLHEQLRHLPRDRMPRLAEKDEIRADGSSLKYEIRVLNDSFALTTTVLRRGPLGSQPVEAFVPESYRGESTRKYLGQFTLVAAETSPTATDQELRELVGRLANRHGLSNPVIVVTPLAAMAFETDQPPTDGMTPRACLVYRQGATVADLVRVWLPELLLYSLKTRVVHRDVFSHDLDAARREDERLRELIDRSKTPSALSPDDLFNVNDRLTTLQAELSGVIADVENRVHTGRLASRHFRRAARDCGLAAEDARRLHGSLIARWQTPLQEQARVTLFYRRRTASLARIQFESLQATAKVHESRETRSLAKVMAALTCAQVAGVFVSIFDVDLLKAWLGTTSLEWIFRVRVVMSIVTTVLLYWLAWHLFLRRSPRAA